MNDSIYKHLKLDKAHNEIRLVEIGPSINLSAPLQCTLRKAKLSDDVEYSALSYVWGNVSDRKIIYVNGIRTEITANLDIALRRVRELTSERVVWIDAICINQTDLVERGIQVSSMGQIYGRAKKVLCFLGEAPDGFDTTLASLDTQQLEASFNITVERGRAMDELFFENSLNDLNCAALEDFARNPYWRRTWIVQEITLAREIVVLYGCAVLRWQTLEALDLLAATIHLGPVLRASHPVNIKRSALDRFAGAINSIVRTRERHRRSDTEVNEVLTVMAGNINTEATDARDKIFGFYGLANDSARFVTVDYSLSAAATYESFAQRQIEQTQSLNIILYAGLENLEASIQNLCLPSWVPDWSSNRSGKTLQYPLYSASKGATYKPKSEYINNVLCARGILCDKVIMFKKGVTNWGLEDFLFSRGPNDYPTAVPRLQAIFRAITADKYFASNSRLDNDPHQWFFRLMIGFLTDLGMQANPQGSYAQVATDGLPDHEPETKSLQSRDIESQPSDMLSHSFVLAFRDWAESCIKVLNDMISSQRVPVPLEDGCLNAKTLFKRVFDLQSSDCCQATEVCSNVDHLHEWKETLEKTRHCSSMAEMLELFLGVPGSPDSIHWPGMLETRLESYCWPPFHMTRAIVMGYSYAFVTEAGYIATGSKGIRAGDLVFVLFGCNVPVILRPIGQRYVYIGHCYVEGLMDGQALDLVKAGKAVEQDVEIV